MRFKGLYKIISIDDAREILDKYMANARCPRCGRELWDAEVRWTGGGYRFRVLVGRKARWVAPVIICPRCGYRIDFGVVLRGWDSAV